MLFSPNSNIITRYAVLTAAGALYILLIAPCSCNAPNGKPYTNNNYDKIIDSVNKMYDSGDMQNAVYYLNSITPRFKNLNVEQKFHYYDCNYLFLFRVKKNNEKAMLYADTMLRLFNSQEKKLKFMPLCGQAYFAKGDVLFAEKKYSDAYQNYYQGKLMANNSLDDCTLSDYSYRMGMIMYKQQHFRQAATYFKKSSTEISSCTLTFRSFYRRQELLNNTGLSYSKVGEPDSAMTYYKKAVIYIDSTGIRFKISKGLLDVAQAVIYGNEADIYIEKNNLGLAEKLLKQSVSVNLKKGKDNNDAQLSELKLAHLYAQQNKADSLIGLLQNIREQFDSVKSQKAEADWNLLMANYFMQKNDSKNALGYLVRYNSLKDSISNADKKLKEADINEQMERLTKNYEFANLEKHNRLQNMYLKIAVIFGLMLILIIFPDFFELAKI